MNACRYVTGEEPTTIGAAEVKTDPRKFAEVDETIVWDMTFPSGVVATCSTTYNYNGVNKYTAYADRGSFGLEPAYSYGGIRGIANGKPIEAPEIDQFAAEIDDFATCIKEDRPTKVPGEEGLKDLIALEAVYRSIREASRVDVSGNVRK